MDQWRVEKRMAARSPAQVELGAAIVGSDFLLLGTGFVKAPYHSFNPVCDPGERIINDKYTDQDSYQVITYSLHRNCICLCEII